MGEIIKAKSTNEIDAHAHFMHFSFSPTIDMNAECTIVQHSRLANVKWRTRERLRRRTANKFEFSRKANLKFIVFLVKGKSNKKFCEISHLAQPTSRPHKSASESLRISASLA